MFEKCLRMASSTQVDDFDEEMNEINLLAGSRRLIVLLTWLFLFSPYLGIKLQSSVIKSNCDFKLMLCILHTFIG